MRKSFRYQCWIFLLLPLTGFSQFHIDGTVVDIGQKNLIEGVRVVSTNGTFAITDSMGRFDILSGEADSLTFFYNGKPTQKFAVAMIPDPSNFRISLHIPVNTKYHLLKEVTVYSNTYRQDSIENRMEFANVFNYQKPGLSTSISPDGGVGADLDQIINIFRFKRNKRMKALQERLEAQEQEKYIDYRFSRITVQRITGLRGNILDTFLKWYRPNYEFARFADEVSFNQYILNALYQFRHIMKVPEGKEQEPGT